MNSAAQVSAPAASSPLPSYAALWEALDEVIVGAASLRLDSISPRTVDHASLVFADAVGVMLAGGQFQPVRMLLDELGGSTGRSQVAFDADPRDAMTAALVNGTCGTVPELDELLIGGGVGGHPSMHVLPAVVAIAQEVGATGEQLLKSFMVGYEVTAQLFQWFDLDERVQPHGHLGTIGAAAAVAELTGGDPRQACRIASALPIVALWDTTLEGASVHYTYTGLSASLGILAARMARAGFTGPQAAMGLSFAGLLGRPAAALGQLASPSNEWLIESNMIKYMACCGRNFPAMDAALKVRDVDLPSVERILIETDELAARLAGAESLDELTIKFSLEYAVAAALVYGRTDRTVFEAVDPVVVDLMSKISVTVSAERGGSLLARAARVIVSDRDGIHAGESNAGAGYWRAPLDAVSIEQKFVDLVTPFYPGSAEDLFARLRSVAKLEDIRRIW